MPAVRLWAGLDRVDVLLDRYRVKTLPSRLDARDLARLAAAGARPAGPLPLSSASGDLIEVERTVNGSGNVNLGNHMIICPSRKKPGPAQTTLNLCGDGHSAKVLCPRCAVKEEGAVADERKFATAESLRPVVRAAFGGGRRLLNVDRLAGGSKKGAYRLAMDDGGTALVYAWDDSEDYWQDVLPERSGDPADPFSHASGLAFFEAAARRLAAAGVRCPEILFTDRSRALYPADIAVVEDATGGSLETLLDKDPAAAERPLSVLADWLAAMSAVRSPSPGKVVFIDAGGRSPWTSCERAVLGRALAELSEVAGRDRRVASSQRRLEELLHSLAEPIEPRAAWALVHGELGPDHVLLDHRGQPVLIDIEGAQYFDVETEHVWTRMRFGVHYSKLSRGGLDEDRLRFYQLCMHLNLVAGPLRIADTSHPEHEWFRWLAEHHLELVLQFRI